MFISDVMTTKVITVSSSTSLADVRRLMDIHNIRRLPVVDKGKLVGIVTRAGYDKAGPSNITSLNIHETIHLLSKMTVKEILVKDLVTVSPDATVEEAVALAQKNKVGSLLVVDEGKLVGIATTNDFFYKILNPILGIGKPGSRIVVHDVNGPIDVEKVVAAINKLGLEVITMFMLPIMEKSREDFVVHLKSEDPTKLIAELRLLGFSVERRAR